MNRKESVAAEIDGLVRAAQPKVKEERVILVRANEFPDTDAPAGYRRANRKDRRAMLAAHGPRRVRGSAASRKVSAPVHKTHVAVLEPLSGRYVSVPRQYLPQFRELIARRAA